MGIVIAPHTLIITIHRFCRSTSHSDVRGEYFYPPSNWRILFVARRQSRPMLVSLNTFLLHSSSFSYSRIRGLCAYTQIGSRGSVPLRCMTTLPRQKCPDRATDILASSNIPTQLLSLGSGFATEFCVGSWDTHLHQIFTRCITFDNLRFARGSNCMDGVDKILYP